MNVLVMYTNGYIDDSFEEFNPQIFEYWYDAVPIDNSPKIQIAIVSLNTMDDLISFEQKIKERGNRYYNGLIINYLMDGIEYVKTHFIDNDSIRCNDKDNMVKLLKQCSASLYIYDGYIE